MRESPRSLASEPSCGKASRTKQAIIPAMKTLKKTTLCLSLVTVLAVGLWAAVAQQSGGSRLAPGDFVSSQLLAAQGGPAGRELAKIVGKRPLLLAYWRPQDHNSEAAVVDAWRIVREGAREAEFLPLAVLAASQSPTVITQRAKELGLDGLAVRQDNGTLARLFGVRQVPSFVLIDVSGVLRAVGGSSITQLTESGASIAGELANAVSGKPVQTLGVLSSRPIYRHLGKPLPDVEVTEYDGKTPRKISSLLDQGKRVLVVYWIGTCSHCKHALPKLRQWYQAAAPDDLVIVDVARGDHPELRDTAAQFIQGYPWLHWLDSNASAGRRWLVTETPTAFLVSPDGKVDGIQVGGDIDWARWLGR